MRFILTIALLGALSHAKAALWPDKDWATATPESQGMSDTRLEASAEYAVKSGGSGCIIRHGFRVKEWGDQAMRYDLKSTSKSIGVTVLGLALKDGKVQLDDAAGTFHPSFGVPPESNANTGWIERITLRHLGRR